MALNGCFLVFLVGVILGGGEATSSVPSTQAAPTAAGPLTATQRVVFDGQRGWTHEGTTYRLACGANVVEAPNGDLLCWWLSGSGHEPATDNNVLMTRSVDGGKTWDQPHILVAAGEMAGALTCMYPTSDGRLIAFRGAHWPSEKQYTVWYYFRMESIDSGRTWSEPKRVRIGNDNVAFARPIRLANGEFLFPAQYFDKRPRPLTGPVSRLVHAKSDAEALGIPPETGEPGPHKFGTHLHGCRVLISKDETAFDLREYGAICNRPLGLLEPTCVQLKDGRIVMLMRAEWAGCLWRTESKDSGRTWLPAWPTDIPNPTSLACLVQLNDGRIALIHNAVGKTGAFLRRSPLSVWISDDEMETWSIKQDVLSGGSLAYPNGVVLRDNRFVFVYDRDRRQVCFVEIMTTDAARQRLRKAFGLKDGEEF